MAHTDIVLSLPCRADAWSGSKLALHFAVMPFPCTIMPKTTGIKGSLRQGEVFNASQHYRRARAPVVGSGADRLRVRAATGQARCPQRPDGTLRGSVRHGLGPRRAH